MISQQITDTVNKFVNEIRHLAMQLAQESMSQALGPVDGKSDQAWLPTAYLAGVKKTSRAKGAKRTPAELDALTKRLLHYIQGHPGERIETIGKAMKVKTKELLLPVKKLIASSQISTEGVKRSTTYTAVIAKSKKSKKSGAKKGKK